jgi:type VI secretion system protein ImpB
MSDSPSVAPRERVNLRYRSRQHGNAERELPLRLLAVGDYAGRRGASDMHAGKSVVRSINKDNFDAVLGDLAPTLTLTVPDRISGDGDSGRMRRIDLKFDRMADFLPDAIVDQDEGGLRKLLELRRAFVSLKGPYASVPAFREMLGRILEDESAIADLRRELGIDAAGSGPRADPEPSDDGSSD